jgi:hypothetical protein
VPGGGPGGDVEWCVVGHGGSWVAVISKDCSVGGGSMSVAVRALTIPRRRCALPRRGAWRARAACEDHASSEW